ncbi:hypothetical protein SARC_01006 [Sphaeroforma arctica JP610]|uniref:Uncharacterized protein n=1 Tax=Sphaeroforma arctica JP610 TaxID=667725 RepID=A0A0L0GCW5_9EUKA|nr:hypothetical protein SARC_01006 [Sphaeroforma arctica JP610]KNC86860.1 hypothetical protein SARC_01006 [Sphaeroforma arctica JP610]|eukprot:XP_014160762.1 hypothetical protein SARC_01006 [Sphaeroforma arctica JP610]
MSALNTMLGLQKWIAGLEGLTGDERTDFWCQTFLFTVVAPILGGLMVYYSFIFGYKFMCKLDAWYYPDTQPSANEAEGKTNPATATTITEPKKIK